MQLSESSFCSDNQGDFSWCITNAENPNPPEQDACYANPINGKAQSFPNAQDFRIVDGNRTICGQIARLASRHTVMVRSGKAKTAMVPYEREAEGYPDGITIEGSGRYVGLRCQKETFRIRPQYRRERAH